MLPSTTSLPVTDGIYHIEAWQRYPKLLHAISTRLSPDGADWNLSTKRGTPQHPPDPAVALANRRKLAQRLDISLDNIVGCRQIHGTQVALVTRADAGRGMYPHLPSIEGADALLTCTPDLYLLALSADCPPVFFYDPARGAIGLAHSGWRGTIGRIAANVVEAMVDNFGSDPADIVAAIGPGIGPCCYSIGQNVLDAAKSAFALTPTSAPPILEEREGLTYFNLPQAIHQTLCDAGIPEKNITVEPVCTAHNTNVFYSHRAEAGQCGLFGALLGLHP
ncbi:MAG TPA: peptidoglycan editing factor PgeF [Chloroflexia bacterium]|nr:peptidoglycan editing factor PgeF [Chloroflexia bacterium]